MTKPYLIIADVNPEENFFPLNLLRPVFDIKFGALSIREKLIRLTGRKKLSVICDEKFSGVLENESSLAGKDNLIINSNHIPEKAIIRFIEKNPGKVIAKDKKVLGCFYEKNLKNAGQVKDLLDTNNVLEYPGDVRLIEYAWDTIRYKQETLEEDLEILKKDFRKSNKPLRDVNVLNKKNIFINSSVNIFPGCVLDASEGVILIEENSIIEPFTYIKGPAYIGQKVKIKAGTKIYGPASIGYYSKVSGEISGCIFHSYVNKQHDGFTGDSYFCPFVNLGADTVTSNLKNNYSEISVTNLSGEHKTGMQFLGSLIGDHSKTSINTMLNTGSLIGAFANLFGSGFHKKFIDSFTWNESGKPPVTYDVDKAMVTAKMVMGRRNRELNDEYKKLYKTIFNNASKQNK